MVEQLLALLFTLLAVLGLLANILGLPGNWLIVLMASGGWLIADEGSRLYVSWWVLLAIVLVAVFGELLEFAASALGTARLGGSKRGTVLSIVGSMVGAVLGLFLGNLIPIPLVGPVIASLLLGGGGAFAGAAVGERWAGKEWEQSLEIGNAAFWGRLFGTVGKVACGTLVCGIYLVAIWI
jgi:uncharacterized protein